MSKKDFIALADMLRDLKEFGVPDCEWDNGYLHALKDAEDALVGFCKAQNPRFNENRWRDYLHGKCGPSGGKVK